MEILIVIMIGFPMLLVVVGVLEARKKRAGHLERMLDRDPLYLLHFGSRPDALPGSYWLYRGLVLALMVLPVPFLVGTPQVAGVFLALVAVLTAIVWIPMGFLILIAGGNFEAVVMICFLVWLVATLYVILQSWKTEEEVWVHLMQGNLYIAMAVLWMAEAALMAEDSAKILSQYPMELRITGLMTALTLTIFQALLVFRPVEHQVYAAPDPGEQFAESQAPVDLDDESGYCEHCGRLMPSRDGQCLTCGSVVHVA